MLPRALKFNAVDQKVSGLKRRVDSSRSYRLSHQDFLDAVNLYLESLDSPRSLAVWLLFREGEHQQLVDLGFDPRNYDVHNFSSSYAASHLFAKSDFLDLDVDREALAYEKLLRTEVECWKVNERFLDLSTDSLYQGPVVQLHDDVIRKIRDILVAPNFKVIFDCADWGPGATQLLNRNVACSANKYQLETDATPDLADCLEAAGFPLNFSPSWARAWDRQRVTRRAYNFVTFVPKTSKIDRSIAIEAGLNIWFQKGVGGLIRRCLRKCGVDLNHSDRNQDLARKGSIDDSVATIDFSSASDSISLAVVRALLSPEWFQVLMLGRSHFGLYPEAVSAHSWEKFSSMGNGFTFELESLIFYAIAYCCCIRVGADTELVHVHGDDVTMPTQALPLFRDLCDFYGLTINSDKSFSFGPFRESCGGHFYSGVSVKPIYLKKQISKLPDVFKFHNRIVERSLLYYGRDSQYKKVARFLVFKVPKPLRLRVPLDYGDGGFISSFDEAVPSICRHYIEGYKVEHLVERSIPFAFAGEGLVTSSLRAIQNRSALKPSNGHAYLPSNFVKNDVSPVDRKGFTKYVIGKSVCSTWLDPGPWL